MRRKGTLKIPSHGEMPTNLFTEFQETSSLPTYSTWWGLASLAGFLWTFSIQDFQEKVPNQSSTITIVTDDTLLSSLRIMMLMNKNLAAEEDWP